MNAIPIFLAFIIPWTLFVIVLSLFSFRVHYDYPWVLDGILVCIGLVLLVVLYFAVMKRLKAFDGEREPSWLTFMFLTMALAVALGVVIGETNYQENTKPYFDQLNLEAYVGIYPNRMRGMQLMDAGAITFANGSYVDVTKSMGFKNQQVYCVAPIVFSKDNPNQNVTTYDFWAVGTECCSGSQADFHCPNFNAPHAQGGVRLMRDIDRPFYRLAVQQAEATYNIKAVHPLFFTWVIDAPKAVLEWWEEGRRIALIGVCAYFIFQIFLVTCASIAFSKITRNP